MLTNTNELLLKDFERQNLIREVFWGGGTRDESRNLRGLGHGSESQICEGAGLKYTLQLQR